MKIYTTVAREVLDRYNEIVTTEDEHIRMITEDEVGDVVAGIMLDSIDGDEYTVDAYFLKRELEFALCEWMPSALQMDYETGVITHQKRNAQIAHYKAMYKHFAEFVDASTPVEPWFVAEI